MVARRAHNPKVAGSNPAPATTFQTLDSESHRGFRFICQKTAKNNRLLTAKASSRFHFSLHFYYIYAFLIIMSNILTVTQLNYSVRHLLEMEMSHIWLTGEISNFSQPVSGALVSHFKR